MPIYLDFILFPMLSFPSCSQFIWCLMIFTPLIHIQFCISSCVSFSLTFSIEIKLFLQILRFSMVVWVSSEAAFVYFIKCCFWCWVSKIILMLIHSLYLLYFLLISEVGFVMLVAVLNIQHEAELSTNIYTMPSQTNQHSICKIPSWNRYTVIHMIK